jgi:uncharacterized protein YeeX (DUF496 family)
MCPFISWCNANEGFFSLVLSSVAIALSIKAIYQTRTQIKMNDKQQNQNVSLTLLPLRKNVLKLFSEEKYNDLIWDAQILFDESTFSEIKKVNTTYCEFQELNAQISEYERRMSEDMPDLYDEYRTTVANIDRAESYEVDCNILYNLCDGYHPIIDDELIDFQELSERRFEIHRKYTELRKTTLALMKAEITRKTTT